MLVEAVGVWEKFDAAGFSLPTICDALDHPEVLRLVGTDSDLPTPPPQGPVVVPSAIERQNSIRKLQTRLDEVARRVKNDAVLLKMRNYRNKYAAHPIIYTREERSKKSEFENPSFGEVRELISTASEIMIDLQIATLGYTYDYIQMRDQSMIAPFKFYAGMNYSEEQADRILSAGPQRLEIPEETDIEKL